MFILLASAIVLTSCMSHRGTLYLDKSPTTYSNGSAGTNYNGVLTPKEQNRVLRHLERQTPRPILVIGKDKSINSYREFCEVMGIPFPTVLAEYNVVNGPAIEGMDYKDIWLSQGPPVAIFVTDEFVTWRYKDDSLTVFVGGRTVTLNRQR
jgi:hypothetical protein